MRHLIEYCTPSIFWLRAKKEQLIFQLWKNQHGHRSGFFKCSTVILFVASDRYRHGKGSLAVIIEYTAFHFRWVPTWLLR